MQQSTTHHHAGVSFDAVAGIVETILAEGGKPTLRGIRERLGTGSLGTIQQHLGVWRNEHRPAKPTTRILPESLQRSFAAEIENQRGEVRAELAQQLENEQTSVKELTEENNRLSKEIDSLKLLLEEANNQVNQAEGQTKQLTTQLADALANVNHHQSNIESLRQDLVRTEIRLEGYEQMKQENSRLNGRIEDERILRIQAEGKTERYEERATRLTEQLTEAKAELSELRKKEKTLHESDKLNAIMNARLELAAREIEKTNENARNAWTQYQKAQEHASRLEGKLDLISTTERSETKTAKIRKSMNKKETTTP